VIVDGLPVHAPTGIWRPFRRELDAPQTGPKQDHHAPKGGTDRVEILSGLPRWGDRLGTPIGDAGAQQGSTSGDYSDNGGGLLRPPMPMPRTRRSTASGPQRRRTSSAREKIGRVARRGDRQATARPTPWQPKVIAWVKRIHRLKRPSRSTLVTLESGGKPPWVRFALDQAVATDDRAPIEGDRPRRRFPACGVKSKCPWCGGGGGGGGEGGPPMGLAMPVLRQAGG